MAGYFPSPFPFHELLKGSNKSAIQKLTLGDSIRTHLRSLVLMRVGEFSFDRSMGFEIWDYDKQVFFHEKVPYYDESEEKKRRILEDDTACKKQFNDNLKKIIKANELRLSVKNVHFDFEKVDGNKSVYQRKIKIKVEGHIKSTGKLLNPAFEMNILYTPFQVESN